MKALVFATAREAKPFLLKAGIRTEHIEGCSLFDLRPTLELTVLICGKGPGPALDNTAKLLATCPVTSVLNAGIAGALRTGVAPGAIFNITGILAWPATEITKLCRPPAQPLPAAILATVEQPVFDTSLRTQIAAFANLVDMEGAAIAQACRLAGNIPFSAIKAVTDFAGEGDRKMLYENIDRVSEQLADILAGEPGCGPDQHCDRTAQ